MKCTEKCKTQVDCITCGRKKKPIGRDAPPGSYVCSYECEGYNKDPYPPNQWPDELIESDE